MWCPSPGTPSWGKHGNLGSFLEFSLNYIPGSNSARFSLFPMFKNCNDLTTGAHGPVAVWPSQGSAVDGCGDGGDETGASSTLQETCSLRDFAPFVSLAETDATVIPMR